MFKKITLIASVFALVVLNGCDENVDPQILLREALGNAFTIESTKFESTLDVQIENVEETNGSINFIFTGKGENILDIPSTLEYSVDAKFDLENAELGAIAGELKLGFKIVEEAFFGIIEKFDLSGSPEMEAAKPFIQMFSNNWYKFSLSNIPEMVEQMDAQKEIQKELIAIYKKLLTENDILLVESLNEDGANFILEIAPNFDLIFSRDFIKNNLFEILKSMIENSTLDEAERDKILAEMEFDEEVLTKLPEIRKTAEKIWTLGNFEITFEIDKNDRIVQSSAMSGEVDLAELQKIIPEPDQSACTDWQVEQGLCGPTELSGKIIFDVVSNLSEINQSQNIIPPEEFIDFDPALIFGMGVGMGMDEPEIMSEMEMMSDDELGAVLGENSLEMELPEDAPIARPQN